MPAVDALSWQAFFEGLIAHGLRTALVVGLVLLGRRLAPHILPSMMGLTRRVYGAGAASDPDEYSKRQQTITKAVLRTIDVLLLLVGGLTILAEIGISIAPLLAGAGVAGVAFGFGAQTLVRDVLSGLFILLENQYGHGDVVQAAGVSGLVEEVNLRRTVLRDMDGIVHSVPNGEIRVASNLTRGWSRVNMDLRVSYGEDLDHVRQVLDGVGAELAADPEWAEMIVEAPKVLRVEGFEDFGVTLKMLATTKPIKQWDVAGELRRRIKLAFDAAGIEIAYPQRVLVEAAHRRHVESVEAPHTQH